MEMPVALASAEILVVEDEMIVAYDLQRRLDKLGYTVVGMVTTGKEAVREAAEHTPDLVLMDISLSDGKTEGIEAAKIITETFGIPVIFLTALTDSETINRARYAKPSSYLVKPYTEIELKSNIEIAVYRGEMERRLKESEDRYRIVTSFTSDFAFSFFLDVHGRIQLEWFTPAVEDITGYTGEELKMIDDPLTIIHPGDKTRIKRFLRYISRGDSFNIEHRILRKDGAVRWVRTKARPSGRPQADQERVQAFGAVEDISELKRIEEIEKAKEQNYQTMIKKMNDGLVMVDPAGTITFVNDKLCSLTGFGRFYFIGSEFTVLVRDDQKHLIEELWRRCKTSENETFETALRTKSGAPLYVRLSPTVLNDSRKRFSGCFAIISDITREKQKNDELAAGKGDGNQELLRIFESSHIALIEHDVESIMKTIRSKKKRVKNIRTYMAKRPDFVDTLFHQLEITYANGPALKLFEADSKEIILEDVYRSSGDEVKNIFKDAVLSILEGDRSVQISLPLRTAGGDPLQLMAAVLVSPGLEKTGRVYMSLMDVTLRERERNIMFDAEKRFRTVFEESPYAICICSGDGKLLNVNRAFKKIWKLSDAASAKMIQAPVSRLIRKWPADIRDRVEQGFSGRVVDLPPFGVGRGGADTERRYLRGIVFPLPDETGKPDEVIIVQENLCGDEKKPLFEDSREKDFESILEGLPRAVTVADENRNILFCNERCLSLLDCKSKAGIIGKSVFSWIHPSAGQEAIEQFNRLYETAGTGMLTVPMVSKHRRCFTAEINSSILQNSTKHRKLMISLFREV